MISKDALSVNTSIDICPAPSDIGQTANYFASKNVFADYMSRKSNNTLRAHRADLDTFCAFLVNAGVSDCPGGEVLQSDATAWHGVTWGLVQAFVKASLNEGVALSTVNRRLSTVKAYAALANKAGVIDTHELIMLKSVQGYGKKEYKRIDEKRPHIRKGAKKAQNTTIRVEDAKALKSQPDTPQGHRDAVMMCLLLDHGLRVGEVAALTVTDVNLQLGELVFWREKVQKQQRHRLTPDTHKALQAYLKHAAPAIGFLLRGSNKSGLLTNDRMSTRAVNNRVRTLGKATGIENLSPHDCRHYWATRAIQKGTDPFALKQAGGWNSMSTVARYVDENKIANDGVIL